MPQQKSSRSDRSHYDQIVKLVEQVLELHQQLSAAKTPQEKTSLERQSTTADGQIDRLVYDLYGLTGEEIAIVEEATASANRTVGSPTMAETSHR